MNYRWLRNERFKKHIFCSFNFSLVQLPLQDSEQFQNLSANPWFDGEVLYAMYVTGSVDSKIRFFCTQGLLYHLN